MANWDSVLRQILLRGNFFAGDVTAVSASYDATSFNDASLTQNGAEYPLKAILDAALQAMKMLVTAIGENRETEYRRWFYGETANIASGGLIPMADSVSATKLRYGRIGAVRDATDGRVLMYQPREMIFIANTNPSRRVSRPYHFYTDDMRIWHTRDNIKADIVVWDQAAERAAVIANAATTVCSLPEPLLPALEFGALAFAYRDTFRFQDAQVNWAKFAPEVNRIAGKEIATAELLPRQ